MDDSPNSPNFPPAKLSRYTVLNYSFNHMINSTNPLHSYPCACVCVRACVRACVCGCVRACVCIQSFFRSKDSHANRQCNTVVHDLKIPKCAQKSMNQCIYIFTKYWRFMMICALDVILILYKSRGKGATLCIYA